MIIEFVNEEITSWRGVSILKKTIDLSGFSSCLNTLPFP
jgi:hypothetical protein